MTIHRLEEGTPPSLRAALKRFERQFTYPLGADHRFHISHGEDYPRFFRAIGGAGKGVSFVAENGAEILGTLGVALRPVQMPDGAIVTAAYLGDLKTAPDARRARVLVAMAARAFRWAMDHGASAAYGVVMDGTPRSPATYSGRFGIPAFGVAGKVCVLRLPAVEAEENVAFNSSFEAVERCFRALSGERFAPLGGDGFARSQSAPVALAAPDASACGILEDTRRAKRLLLDDGGEMVSGHLSKFAYSTPQVGAALIRQALARCQAPAMFVSVPEVDTPAFLPLLSAVPGIIQAPATLYAAGLPISDGVWNISTSEI